MKINKERFPYCYSGYMYAKDIVNSRIVSSKYVLGACRRFFRDLDSAEDPDNWYTFDLESAERFLRLVQKFQHVKGVWADPHIKYEPWQNFIFMNVYGFINKKTKSRRFRTCYIEVARGNGKSLLAAQVGLYHLSLEDPVGNEVYSAATGREQARIILDSARAMANKNKSFCKATGTEVMAHSITHKKSNSYFKALSSDGKTLDGLQPACALIDELHSHKTDEVYNVIESAMAKRRDSLLFIITTAGFSTVGIGYSQSQYNKKIAAGEVENDRQFSIVYCIDEKDDPYDSKNWIKANPNMEVSVDFDKIETTSEKAKDDPSTRNNFLVKHLNLWLDAASPFFNKEKWVSVGDPNLDIRDFCGEKCYMAVDLAHKIDIASIAIIFRREVEEIIDDEKKKVHKYFIFTRNYCPEDTIKDSKNKNYITWSEKEHLISIRGAMIDIDQMENDFYDISQGVKLLSGFFDPWNAIQFAQRLIKKRLEMVEFRQNTGNMSEPTKQLDAEIRAGNIFHDGNEVTNWCIGNIVAQYDNKDNVYPKKENPELKIDSAIAIIMAFAGWVQEKEEESVYEEKDFIFL